MHTNRLAIAFGILVLALAAGTALLMAQQPPIAGPPPQHLVIKICNWDGVVPQAALDGFRMPAGKWVELQKDGWHFASYLIAPSDDSGKQGFYAVLKR